MSTPSTRVGAKTALATRHANRSAVVFAALGDETRLAIVTRLCRTSPQSISQLAAGAPITRQGLSKHLRVLEGAGLVASQRQGRETLFRFEPERLDQAKEYLEAVSAQWEQALQRLKTFVES